MAAKITKADWAIVALVLIGIIVSSSTLYYGFSVMDKVTTLTDSVVELTSEVGDLAGVMGDLADTVGGYAEDIADIEARIAAIEAGLRTPITLSFTFAAPGERYEFLMSLAMGELQKRHPELALDYKMEVLPYGETHDKLVTYMAAGTPRDLISVDCIWLGEYAEGGFLMDITDKVEEWGRIDEWYPENQKGSMYNGKYYGIWTWTDARLIWYWKDVLADAGVDPSELATWDGYIAAYDKLELVTGDPGELYPEMEAVSLCGMPWAVDLWFPYLWMNGGEILELQSGHPTKGTYWYPAFNSPAGIEALTFLKSQVDAGITPVREWYWGAEFADRKFAVMIEGTWMLARFPEEEWATLPDRIGAVPMFPVPEAGTDTATMMGGWVLAIPATSMHPELAWELMTIIQDPDFLTEMLAKFAYLPTQKTIAEVDPWKSTLEEAIPFYSEFTTILPYGRGRPNIPEYPEVADILWHAIDYVYTGVKTPATALADAEVEAAEALGW